MSSYHKKTILQVIPSLIAGGVERGTLDVSNALAKSGWRSIVVSAGGSIANKIIKGGGEHVRMGIASKNPLKILWNILTLRHLVQKNNVDIVHARSRAPAWSAYFASKVTGVHFVTTFHGIYNFSNSIKKYYNGIMTKGERVIAVSNFVKMHILEEYCIDESKIRVIHRGVDHDYFDPSKITAEIKAEFQEKYNIPSNTPVILLPARMSNWKGQMILTKALSYLKETNFYCIMAGDISKHPNFVARLQSMISNLKLQGKIQVFGAEMDMRELYSVADIVLSASIEPEAFGRVVVEAQAMEKIVIATNIGGSAETVEDTKTGYHVIPNDPENLANKIRYALKILGTPAATKIGKAARKSASQNFSLDAMLKKTIAVYEELL